jgi:hypothetical protein
MPLRARFGCQARLGEDKASTGSAAPVTVPVEAARAGPADRYPLITLIPGGEELAVVDYRPSYPGRSPKDIARPDVGGRE